MKITLPQINSTPVEILKTKKINNLNSLICILFCLMTIFAFSFSDDPIDIITDRPPTDNSCISKPIPFINTNENDLALLHDNGPLINSNGTLQGCDLSILRAPLNVFGYNANSSAFCRVADDFIIPFNSGGWFITSINAFTYQTDAGIFSTINFMSFRIWDGVPDSANSQIVFGDTVSNRLVESRFACIYRNADSVSTNRRITRNIAATRLPIPPGHYWIDFSFRANSPPSPFYPPITINGVNATGNAKQKIPGNPVWQSLMSGGYPQGIPFVIIGSQLGCPWHDVPSLEITNALYNSEPFTFNCGGSISLLHHSDTVEFDLTANDTNLQSGDVITLSVGLLPDTNCVHIEMDPPLPITSNQPITVHVTMNRLGNPPDSCHRSIEFRAADNCNPSNQRICRIDVDNPLPIELSSMTSSTEKNSVSLQWMTSKETNNAGFDIERKSDDAWMKVGFVSGQGNTTSPVKYEFTDRNLETGSYKYRLKQIDFNGDFEYYELNNEVVIGVPSRFAVHQNHPNPFNPVTAIKYELPFDAQVNIRVYDITGHEIVTLVNERETAGYHSTEFNASNLSSGVYFYRISAGQYEAVKRMMLIK